MAYGICAVSVKKNYGIHAVRIGKAFQHNADVSLPNEIQRETVRFGANVRRERVARAITQEKLSEMADMDIRTLQRIEAGEINPLLATVLRIQRALNCPWEKLMPPKQGA
ncbi:helix-turn-helix transcriptional regulator [Geminisphaera colitermitum]|uniref:helix-turn-helix transcriptional regulator n=1 Tax=Geminisphaera colitermitum TaxID=1148786 RepID=UPI0001964D44|nr:helix-turn-helix transcriptional regulator [Geminisphaera colitermitum]